MEPLLNLVEWMFATPLTRIFLAATLLSAILLARPVSAILGWRAFGTGLAICGFGGAIAMTFVNRIGYFDLDWTLAAVSQCLGGITQSWAAPEAVLNLMLLAPLGLGLMLGSRKIILSSSLVVATAVWIEMFQEISGLGACQRGDIVRNAVGGLVGVGFGYLWIRVKDRRVPSPPSETPRMPQSTR